MDFFNTNMLNLNPKIDDLLKTLSFVIALIIHDCVYQFIRIFYHSRKGVFNIQIGFWMKIAMKIFSGFENQQKRFKPPTLQMTMSQFATPVIDVILGKYNFIVGIFISNGIFSTWTAVSADKSSARIFWISPKAFNLKISNIFTWICWFGTILYRW